MPSNGGFPPLKIIKKESDSSRKLLESKERFFINKKNMVDINKIIEEVKKPMINMNKDEIKIIDSF